MRCDGNGIWIKCISSGIKTNPFDETTRLGREDQSTRTWRGKHCCVGCMRAIKLLECGMRLAGSNNFLGRATNAHDNSDKGDLKSVG